jgi:hypothetical protein
VPPDCRCRCHSCDPNCATAVVSNDGKLRVALYTVKHVGYGSVLSFDYHGNTDDQAEYYNSKCLCGARSCNTLYLRFTARQFDEIMDSSHTTLNRFAMLARACEHYAVKICVLPAKDADTLASVGFGEKLFRDSPLWLKCYCAQVIEFIKHERDFLPQCCNGSVSKEEADGVYGLRLQNLAITVDRVLSFLRRHPNHLLAPLQPYTDAEVAQKLVFDTSSIWSKFRDYVKRWRQSVSNTGLQKTLEGISERCGQKTHTIEAARDVLHSTATALRMEGSTYHAVAAVFEVQPFSLSMVLLFFIVHSLGHFNANCRTWRPPRRSFTWLNTTTLKPRRCSSA